VALSDEQNAMLRLLAQGEQGYADIAALMGLSEEDVRAKVVGALAQLQAEGKPAPDVPPPIPGGAHPAAEVTPPEPEPIEEPSAAAKEPEPAVADAVAPSGEADDSNRNDAEPQKAAAAAKPQRPSAPKPAPAPVAATPSASQSASDRSTSGGRTVTLPTGRTAWLLGGGILAAIVAIVVVILLVAGGGSDGNSTTASNEGATTAAEGNAETNAGAKPATEAELKAVDGSDAKGFASFGRVNKKLALQVEATGLAPTEEGVNSYAIWLAQNPRKMIPLASVGVKASGRGAGDIAAQFEVPVEILAYLATGTFDQIAITKVDNKRFETGINVATKQKTTPTYLGEEVLRGTITGPIVGLAVREEEEKKAEEEAK
jgi:hypothetical protein